MKQKVVVTVGLLILLLVGCRTVSVGGLWLDKEAGQKKGQAYEVVGSFKERLWASSRFFGHAGGSALVIGDEFSAIDEEGSVNVMQIVKRNIKHFQGDAVVDLEMRWGASALDVFANIATARIWAPSTIIVTGDVIKYVE